MPNIYVPAEVQPTHTFSEHPTAPRPELTVGKVSCKAENAPAVQQADKGPLPTKC